MNSFSVASKWMHSFFFFFLDQNPKCRTINPLWRGPGWLLKAWSSVWSQQRPVNGLERRVPTVWTVLLVRNTEGGRLNPFSRDLEGCESADMLCNPHAGLSRVSATRFSLDGCYSDLDTRSSDTWVARSLLNGEYCILYIFFLFKVQIWHFCMVIFNAKDSGSFVSALIVTLTKQEVHHLKDLGKITHKLTWKDLINTENKQRMAIVCATESVHRDSI